MTDQQENAAQLATPVGRLRARALGVPFGGTPGRWNAITDVPGVEVGYRTVGVFVQANFGARRELVLAGRPLGELLAGDDPVAGDRAVPPGAGSVIAVVLTDAPLLPHQCAALARRVTLGLARTGTAGSHSSGDLFLACSTANPGGFSRYGQRDARHYDQLTFVPWDAIDPFFTAVVQGTEEAVANALCAGEDMTGYRGHRVPGLPRDRVAALFQEDQ